MEECAVDPLGYWIDLAWLVCYLCLLVHDLTHGFAEHEQLTVRKTSFMSFEGRIVDLVVSLIFLRV
mgnify:CR=1 FL=1